MLFLLLDLLLIFNICFVSGIKSQIIDNDTLIYFSDPTSKGTVNYYCQFGTEKEIQNSHKPECLKRNYGMQHTLANGERTYPYIGKNSKIGIKLACGDIRRGKLLYDCERLVHSNCSYECEDNNTRTMRCYLVGPWNNVTAQWSNPDPCPDPVVTQINEGDMSVFTTTEFIVTVVSVSVLVVFLLIAAIVFYRYRCRFCHRCSQFILQCKGDPEHVTVLNTNGSSPAGSDPIFKDEGQNPEVLPLIENNKPQDNNPEVLPLIENNKPQDQNPEGLPLIESNNIPDQNPEMLPRIERIDSSAAPLEIGELQIGLYSIYNRETKNKPKEFVDKNLVGFEYDDRYSTLDPESLKDIKVEYESDTCDNVMCNRAAQIEQLVPASPCTCSAPIELLKQQTSSFRTNLRPELEVLPGRSREQALIGYIEENAEQFKYSQSYIEMIEMSCKSNVDIKASDYFLQRLAEFGTKLGFIVQYFYTHGNYKAVEIILEVHRGCGFCERFRAC